MSAAKNGHFGCVKVLISHGADLTRTAYQHGDRLTPWRIAVRAGHHELSTYILGCAEDFRKLGTTRAHLEKSKMSSCYVTSYNLLSTFLY